MSRPSLSVGAGPAATTVCWFTSLESRLFGPGRSDQIWFVTRDRLKSIVWMQCRDPFPRTAAHICLKFNSKRRCGCDKRSDFVSMAARHAQRLLIYSFSIEFLEFILPEEKTITDSKR